MTIRDWLVASAMALVGWLVISIGIMLVSDQAPAARVLFPSKAFVASFDGDTSLMAHDRLSVTVAMTGKRGAIDLYRSGAWLVLPAGLKGCLPLPDQVQP